MWTVSVKGAPIPKPDPRCFGGQGKGGKVMHRLSIPEKSPGYAPWRTRCTAAGAALHQAIGETLHGPVSIEVEFRIDRPQGHYRTGKHADVLRPSAPAWPTVRRGDIDKMSRLLLDALTDSGVWGDDSQVVQLTATKSYATPDLPSGATITIWRTPCTTV